MGGAIAIIIALVIVVPLAVFISGVVLAAIMGTVLKMNGEKEHEGSELIELNI